MWDWGSTANISDVIDRKIRQRSTAERGTEGRGRSRDRRPWKIQEDLQTAFIVQYAVAWNPI